MNIKLDALLNKIINELTFYTFFVIQNIKYLLNKFFYILLIVN